MQITQINNSIDLVRAADYAQNKFRTEVWWRGQSVSSWKLLPSIYRQSHGKQYEKNITARFVSRASTRHTKCPQVGDWPSWLFFLQHYRLPTRLLDWTESIMIAAFFAVSENQSQSGAIWGLSPFLLNDQNLGKQTLFTPHAPEVYPFFLPPFKRSAQEINGVAAVCATEIDIRMMMQLSAFTIHGEPIPLDNLESTDSFLFKLEIPALAKRHLKESLLNLGVRESNIFPDLEHLAKELAEWQFDSSEY